MTMLQAHTLVRSLVPLQSSPSDADLLATLHRDASAFDTLVERYSDMVLRVCHRVLQHRQDAEDALQATFLIFHRQMHTLRSQASLSSFLHGIALRTSLNLRRLRQRRQWHEAQAARMPVSTEYRWSDVQVVLDEEIARLPEPYREVFIHCCLERTIRAETASILGVKEGTISSRLTQAKKLLQDRLTRRSISLATLLGALSLKEVVATDALRERIVAGVTHHSSMSPAVMALSQTWPRPILHPVYAMLTLLALIVGAAFVCLPESKGLSPDPVKPIKPTSRLLNAYGTVVDAAEKPVAGAKVYLRERQPSSRSANHSGALPADVLAETTTDATGQFALRDVVAPTMPVSSWDRDYPYDVLVVVPGHAIAWEHLTPPLQRQSLYLQLKASSSLMGTIRQADGKPAVGAVIEVQDITGLRRMPRHSLSLSYEATTFQNSRVRLRATTDANGRFTLAQLPEKTTVSLRISYQGCTEQEFYAAVTSEPQQPLTSLSFTQNSGARTEHVPLLINPLDLTLAARERRRVRVLAEDTGLPLDQAEIAQYGMASPIKTDADGWATVHVVAEKFFGITAQGGKTHPEYLQHFVKRNDWKPGDLVIRLPRGRLVTGQVLDAQTKQPVPVADVFCSKTNSNGKEVRNDWHQAAQTDATGRFAFHAPAGKLLLRASIFSKEQLSEDIEVDASSAQPLPSQQLLLFQQNSAKVITGRMMDARGQPVAGAVVGITRTRQRGQSFRHDITRADGSFIVNTGEFMERDDAELVAMHDDLHLGAIVPIDIGDTQRPLTVKLEKLATITGRVLDEKGLPKRNAIVMLSSVTTSQRYSSVGMYFLNITRTDAMGRFRLENVVPDANTRYRAAIRAEGYCRIEARMFSVAQSETHDSGDVTLVPATESIAGNVVDADGKPRANVMLQALPVRREGDTQLQPNAGYFITQADGKFEIHEQPSGSLDLEYEVLKPGDTIMRPQRERIRVQSGDRNIRLVVDK